MTSMNRFGLAALFVIGVALFTSSPAWAQDPITLSSTSDVRDQDYGASGQATLTDIAYSHDYWLPNIFDSNYVLKVFTGQLTVTYWGLTPGATYQITASTWYSDLVSKKQDPYSHSQFTASADGAGEVSVPVSFAQGWRVVFDNWGGEHWEQTSGGRLTFWVERKDRRKYTYVLGGYWNLPWDLP